MIKLKKNFYYIIKNTKIDLSSPQLDKKKTQ